MPALQEIKAQIKSLGIFTAFLSEISELTYILWENERIERLVKGYHDWDEFIVLISSNLRIIFLHKKLTTGLRVVYFPYDQITSVSYEEGFLFGRIKIFTAGNRIEIERLSNKDIKDFTKHVGLKLSKINKCISENPVKSSTFKKFKIPAYKKLLTDNSFQLKFKSKSSLNNRSLNPRPQNMKSLFYKG